MKNVFQLLMLCLITSLVRAQYVPMTIYGGTFLPPDTCSIRAVPAGCYFDSARFEGFIRGGQRPYQYKWTYVSNGNSTAQDFMPAEIQPGHDYIIDILDRFDVTLYAPQPRLSNATGWQGTWKLTVLDSRIQTRPNQPVDPHDTLIVTFKYKWPDQIILPMNQNGAPSCDTCVGEYLWIVPQRGTPPYDIALIGVDNMGNPVEHYGTNCSGLWITNFAELHSGCYDIYVTDKMGCQEVFDYCYTTTGVEELDPNNQLVRIVDITGRPVEPTPNTILLYQYADGTTKKVLITQK